MMNINEYNQYCILTLICETQRGNLCSYTKLIRMGRLLSNRHMMNTMDQSVGFDATFRYHHCDNLSVFIQRVPLTRAFSRL